MQLLSIALVLGAALVDQTLAHYRFNRLIAPQGTNPSYLYPPYQYIRFNDNLDAPLLDANSINMRCNSGAGDGTTTDKITVAANTLIGFRADVPINHPGPFNIYMAKAPTGDAKTWDGSGFHWFRVWTKGPLETPNGLVWDAMGQQEFTFTVPACLSPGDYLVRMEHIALHGAGYYGGAQYHMSCAQITVTGGGTANPTPNVAIPGVYSGYEQSILINLYYPIHTTYTPPGPPIFTCP